MYEDEEHATAMYIFIFIFLCILFCAGYAFGYCDQDREKSSRIEDVKQTTVAQQSEFNASIEQLRGDCDRLMEYSRSAKQLTSSMGEQLGRDGEIIDETIDLLKTLEENMHSSDNKCTCCSNSNSCRNDGGYECTLIK